MTYSSCCPHHVPVYANFDDNLILPESEVVVEVSPLRSDGGHQNQSSLLRECTVFPFRCRHRRHRPRLSSIVKYMQNIAGFASD